MPHRYASDSHYTEAGSAARTVLLDLRYARPEIEVLSVVALLEDPRARGLRRGQAGTVVERIAPGVYEVEFSDDEGRTYASLALRAEQLMLLHHQPDHQAA